jgi:hypothetical protein
MVLERDIDIGIECKKGAEFGSQWEMGKSGLTVNRKRERIVIQAVGGERVGVLDWQGVHLSLIGNGQVCVI